MSVQQVLSVVGFVGVIGVCHVSSALACDWAVTNDVFDMALRADQVLIVHADGPQQATTAEVVAVSDGVTPSTVIALGKSGCDPALEPGVDYLAFRTATGGPVSDRSSAMLVGADGERLVQTVRDWRSAVDDDERVAILMRLARQFDTERPVDGCERPWATRLPGDAAVAAKRLGLDTVAFERTAFSARSTPLSGLTHPRANWLTLIDRADNVALVVAEAKHMTRTVDVLKGRPATTRQRLTLPLHVGESYLIASKAVGPLVHPAGWVRVVGDAGERLIAATKAWVGRSKDPASSGTQSVVESVARAELLARPSHAQACSPASRWRLGTDVLSRVIELVDEGKSLEPATCRVLQQTLSQRSYHDPMRAWWRDDGYRACVEKR